MIDLDGFAGPGGWDEAARMLGLRTLGLEMDAAACATRAAAGHRTVRADVSQFPVERLAGKVRGSCWSPPCTTFSNAGKRAGVAITDVLDALIRDLFEDGRTRAAHRREMASMLRRAWWPSPKLTRAERSAAIWKAVRSASLVAEPARFIHACHPEWVALEQVPAVLPLWRVYADELTKAGYSTWCGTLNSADYGVPQTRVRAILIASRLHRVTAPVPTHYDPRKGDQLWGVPWVSMAEALGWGATERPAPTATAGGVAQGGYEPFAKGGRECLAREQEAGRWALRRSRGEGMLEREGRGGRRDHPLGEPAPTITSADSKVGANLTWVLHTNRGQEPDGTRQTVDPSTAPAPALTAKSGGQWNVKVRTSFGTPATTGGHHEMDPATRPSHVVTTKAKDWIAFTDGVDSVRITVQEAAILQSFRPDYPWRGTKTKQFEQVGNAIPPLLAEHVLAMAAGIERQERAARLKQAG